MHDITSWYLLGSGGGLCSAVLCPQQRRRSMQGMLGNLKGKRLRSNEKTGTLAFAKTRGLVHTLFLTHGIPRIIAPPSSLTLYITHLANPRVFSSKKDRDDIANYHPSNLQLRVSTTTTTTTGTSHLASSTVLLQHII